jgi:23S rRNA G2069 N7-methylase RlmK/C1962 C5-methylase RlmI
MNQLLLRKGREKALRRRHPWIFSGAVEKASGKAGETLEVRDASGKVLAHAAYSPKSQIRARVWTFDPSEEVDAAFFRHRIQRALALREALPAAKHTNALRLVNGESDGLPGLVVDRYADVLVAQFLAAGVERWRDPILPDHRVRAQLPRRRRAGPEDRLLPRPAREPQPGARACRRPRSAGRLQLHRRLLDRRARRRREARDCG